jgi:hypothetical protein
MLDIAKLNEIAVIGVGNVIQAGTHGRNGHGPFAGVTGFLMCASVRHFANRTF